MKIIRRKDGMWVGRISYNGKRISFYASSELTERQAQREINRKMMDYQRSRDRGRTFGEIYKEWSDIHSREIKGSTVYSYKILGKDVEEYFGDIPIQDITVKDIDRFDLSLVNAGLKKSSRKTRRAILSQVFRYALKRGEVESDPTVIAEKIRGTDNIKSSATEEDEKKVLTEPDEDIAPVIALCTGMRKGEILALEWTDIDLQNKIIHCYKTVSRDQNAHGRITTTKSKSGNRDIPIIPMLEKILNRPHTGKYVIGDGETFICCTKYNQLYKAYQKRHNINSTMHQLRHSCATYMVESGIDLKTVSTIMGHSNINITLQVYTDVKKRAYTDARDKLQNALNGI